jgi:hypothetical protein
MSGRRASTAPGELRATGMEKLERLLDFLEEHLDEEHVRRTERLHLDAMAFRPVRRLPLTLVWPPEDVEPFPYAEAFDDPAKMLYNELLRTVGGTSTYASALLGDDFPPHVRSNHGIGILSSLFGARCRIINDNMPWVEHMEPAELRKAVAGGVPDLEQALGKRVLDTHRFYLERLRGYPTCFRCVRVTHPDLQSPFDIAHLLMGNDVFLAVVDDPDFVHELLAVVTDTYIAFRSRIEALLTDQAEEGAIYLHGCLFGGRVLIKDDTAIINLSEGMHREFSKSYNDRIFAAFGGGSMHYCGPTRPWAHGAIDTPLLRGINYGNPELQDLAAEYAYWRERGVPILLWGDALCLEPKHRDFLGEVRSLGIRTGMTLAIRVRSRQEAQRVLARHLRESETGAP